MGNRFTILYCFNTILATIVCFLTPRAKSSRLVCLFNQYNFPENHNGEKENKTGNSRKVWLMPGVLEKGNKKDLKQPYQELRKVLWQKKPRRNGIKAVRELGKLALYLWYKGCLLCR